MAIDRHISGRAKWFVAAIVAVTAIVFASAARADDYPSRVVKIVVPSGPAGGYDFVGRAVADQLTKRLGQSVIVENRTGAGTVVGTQSVINAPADGYTLLVGGLSNIIFNESLYKKKPYNSLAQLTPVAIVYNNSYVLVAPKDLPFNSAKELAASPKAKSGEMRLAHPGVGTGQHLAGVAFMKYTGAKFLEVPYRGASAIYPDLITGRVDLVFQFHDGRIAELERRAGEGTGRADDGAHEGHAGHPDHEGRGAAEPGLRWLDRHFRSREYAEAGDRAAAKRISRVDA